MVGDAPVRRNVGKSLRSRAGRATPQRELDAVADTLAGDAVTVALLNRSDALTGTAPSPWGDFNRRLREHFAAVYIDQDGIPVPVWKLAVPMTVADEIDALRGADAESALIARDLDAALSFAGAHPEHNGEVFTRLLVLPEEASVLYPEDWVFAARPDGA